MALTPTQRTRVLNTAAFNDAEKKALVALVEDQADALAAAVAINTAQATSITNLNAWATATATKLNALGAKLNLDAGVTDTNYAVDYDTNPQA